MDYLKTQIFFRATQGYLEIVGRMIFLKSTSLVLKFLLFPKGKPL